MTETGRDVVEHALRVQSEIRLEQEVALTILRLCGYEFIPPDRYYGPTGYLAALSALERLHSQASDEGKA